MGDDGGMDGAGARRLPAALLLFFLLLHVLNQIDRSLVSGFAIEIMHDLALTKREYGLVTGVAFSGVYAITALAAGLLADRLGRVPVLTGGVAVWSVFTALSGMARGFGSLLAARPFVAAGEATLVPTATNIILARTPATYKSAAIGVFFAGIPLGIGSSFVIAGVLGPTLGWRGCFALMGTLGVVATLAVSRVRDPGAAAARAPEASGGGSKVRAFLALVRANSRLRWASLGLVLLHAHVATNPYVQLWLHDDRGMPEARAKSLYGMMFIVFGLAGSFGAGALVDWLQHRHGVDRARTSFVSLALLLPLVLAYRLAPAGSPLFLIGMAASVLVMTTLYAPLFSVIEEELPADLKATSTGINILTLNIAIIGGLGFSIAAASQALGAHGVAQSWTWPLLGADCVTALGVLMVGRAAQLPHQPPPAASATALPPLH